MRKGCGNSSDTWQKYMHLYMYWSGWIPVHIHEGFGRFQSPKGYLIEYPL